MNVLLWHVHGSWTTAFVHGPHRYLVPVVHDRGADGRGRAATWQWPASVVEYEPSRLRDADIDVVIVQRERDEELLRAWTGRRVGRDVAAVWLEHNAPQGRIEDMRHPAADRSDLTLVHVTHTNCLFWDCGSTRTAVIEHGIVDPGFSYSGELVRAAVVINEPVRRNRVVGADLLPTLSRHIPIDLFGMGVGGLRARGVTTFEDLPQHRLHEELGRRRAYLHTTRWTSLGLSLIEAMHIGMPVAALATTEVPMAVPAEAGVVSNDLDVLGDALRRWGHDHEEAAARGKAARAWALAHHGLDRFLSDWNQLLEEVTT